MTDRPPSPPPVAEGPSDPGSGPLSSVARRPDAPVSPLQDGAVGVAGAAGATGVAGGPFGARTGTRVAPRYRTFWRRFGALLVDGLIAGVAAMLIELTLLRPWAPSWLRLSAELVSLLLPPTYMIALHALYGRTIGKRLAGLRVVSHPGEAPIGWGRAALRDGVGYLFALWEFALLAPLIVVGFERLEGGAPPFGVEVLLFSYATWALLEIVTMLASPQRRAVHDMLGGTVVVREGVAREDVAREGVARQGAPEERPPARRAPR